MKKILCALCSTIVLASCGYKTPDCSSAEVKQIIVSSFAEQFENATKNKIDYQSYIKVDDIGVVGRDDELDINTCSANVILSFPPKFSENLYKMFSNEEDYKSFKKELPKEFGTVDGAMYGLLGVPNLFGFGTPAYLYLLGPSISNPEAKSAALQQIKKAIDEDISQPVNVAITYKVSKVETSKGVASNVVWNSESKDDDSTYEGYVIFLRFDKILNEMYN